MFRLKLLKRTSNKENKISRRRVNAHDQFYIHIMKKWINMPTHPLAKKLKRVKTKEEIEAEKKEAEMRANMKKKIKKSARLVELLSELEFSVATFDEEMTSDIEKVLFKLRRFSITEKLLLKTNAGIRLSALVKTFRKKYKKHLEERGTDESDKIVLTCHMLNQVKNTWKAQIREECKEFDDGALSKQEKKKKTKKKKRKKKSSLLEMGKRKKRVKTVEETTEVIHRKAIPTLIQPWMKKNVPEKTKIENRRLAKGLTIRGRRSDVPLHPLVRKICGPKKKKRKVPRVKSRDIDEGVELSDAETVVLDGNESSDMEATYEEIQREEERSRLIGQYEDDHAVL